MTGPYSPAEREIVARAASPREAQRALLAAGYRRPLGGVRRVWEMTR